MDSFFYISGLVTWGVIGLAFALVVALVFWTYITVSVVYWFVVVKSKSIKKDYMDKPFPKTRLLFLILRKPRISADLHGTTINNEKYSVDFTGLLPKILWVRLAV